MVKGSFKLHKVKQRDEKILCDFHELVGQIHQAPEFQFYKMQEASTKALKDLFRFEWYCFIFHYKNLKTRV